VVVEQALVDLVGEAGLVDLPKAGELAAGGVVARIQAIGGGQRHEGRLRVAGAASGPEFFEEELAAHGRVFFPGGRPKHARVGYAVADGAQEQEGGEGGQQVEQRGRGAVKHRGASPERAHVGAVDRAPPGAAFGALKERAEPPEARGVVPGTDGAAGGFPGAAGVAGMLARAASVREMRAIGRLAGVPVEEPPRESEKVGDPSHVNGEGNGLVFVWATWDWTRNKSFSERTTAGI